MPLPASLEPKDDRRSQRRWDVAAVGIFLLASMLFHRSMWGEDWTRAVPVAHTPDAAFEPGQYPGTALNETDHHFVVWLISRNARTLVTAPWKLYEAEPCFPVERSLALGEPGVSLGVLGIPAHLLDSDPVSTYNAVWQLLPLLSALAMYWVVRSWTGLPVAGIVAGLFYAFHPLKVHDPVHFYVYDTVWSVLAFFFVQRLFANARWRDALGLCAVTAMQLAGSLYPVMAAALAGIPFMIVLLRQHGVRRQRPAQWIVIALTLLAAVAVLYGPFLALSSEGALSTRPLQVFRPLSFLLPGEGGFPGWIALLLVGAALLTPAARGLIPSTPDLRFALVMGVVLIEGISFGSLSGDFTVPIVWDGESGPPPNPYMALAQLIPGIGLVRAPAAIFNCAVSWIAVLVGVGTAALVRMAPTRLAPWATWGLIAVIFIHVLRPPLMGLTPEFVFTPFAIRPADEILELYRSLDEKGNQGPLLQVPATPRQPRRESSATLLSAYHLRRTGQCYNSYHTEAVRRVRSVSEGLPQREAIRELAELGFTTLVVSYPTLDMGAPARRRAYEALAALERAPIREVSRTPRFTAYEIAADADSTAW